MSASHFSVKRHVLPCQHIREYPEATASGEDDTLQLAIKQYVPLNNPNSQPGDVTIIAAHAVGIPKEVYEPLWDEILLAAKTHGFRIRSIWIADMANHGASGILNEKNLGTDLGWDDHTRDLLHMVNHFRMPRPIVGIGHSVGGTQIANLALLHPRLFVRLILIEPMIEPLAAGPIIPGNPSMVFMSAYRRDRWGSREEAGTSCRKMYKGWEDRVFHLWMDYGLRDLPSGQVTLTTTKLQEVSSYYRPKFKRALPDIDSDIVDTLPFYRAESIRTFKNMPHLRPETLFIFGKESPYSLPEMRRAKVEVTGGGVGGCMKKPEEVVLEGGHFLPMENVRACARAVAERVGTTCTQWNHDEERFRQDWAKYEKAEISKEWLGQLAPFVKDLRTGKKNKL